MSENIEKDSFDKIAETMVRDLEAAENKEKASQEQVESEIEKASQELSSFEESHEGNEQTESEEESYRKKLAAKQRKIANLQRELGRLKERESLASQEALEYRRQYEMVASKAHTADAASMAHYQNSLNLRKEQLKESLKKAKELNDIDAEADITAAIGKIAAEEKDVEAYNMMQYQAQQYQQPYVDPYVYQQQMMEQQQYYQQEQPVEISDETKEWVNRNPWLMQNHEDFDPEKVEEVLLQSQIIDKNLRRMGREDLIHSKEYYNMLDQYVHQAFGDELSYQPQYEQPSMGQSPQQPSRSLEQSFSGNSRQNVAPVRKGSASNYSPQNNAKFTQADKEILSGFMQMNPNSDKFAKLFAKEKLKMNEKIKRAADSGDLQTLQQYGYF